MTNNDLAQAFLDRCTQDPIYADPRDSIDQEFADFVAAGGELRDSTMEAVRYAMSSDDRYLWLSTRILIRRDVNFFGREHILESALERNKPTRPLFDYETDIETRYPITDADMDAVRAEPSSGLASMIKTADDEPHIRWDRNVAEIARKEARWHAAKRVSGVVDISPWPTDAQLHSTEKMPGVVELLAGIGHPVLVCSTERNAMIPPRLRRDDGTYDGQAGYWIVYGSMPGEAIYFAWWFIADHKRPRSFAAINRQHELDRAARLDQFFGTKDVA